MGVEASHLSQTPWATKCEGGIVDSNNLALPTPDGGRGGT